MKITVIGATGATGRKVVERALELGHDVIAAARRPESITPTARLSVCMGDVFDIASLAKAVSDADAVINIEKVDEALKLIEKHIQELFKLYQTKL